MHRQVIVVLIAMLLSFSAWAVKEGERAPPLSAQSADGGWIKLQDYRGKVVYVDFWASWCAPCQQSLPQYERLYQQLAPSGFQIIAVNVDSDREAATKTLGKLGINFPVVFDPSGAWAETFSLPAMPSGYLVDRRGVVRHIHSGYRAETLPALEALIKETLSDKP